MDLFEAELARESIDIFCSQFGEGNGRLTQAYRDFARHAALPLTFTADLLYRLQERFRSDMRGQPLAIPWIAVADLMLSHLCHKVRSETYRLEETVRLVLLEELQADQNRFWSADGEQSRLVEIAEFLIQYAAHQMNHPSHYVQEAAKAQRLNAQSITEPELVREALQAAAVSLMPQQDPVATLRLASLVDTFTASVNLTRTNTDTTRQDFNKLQTYTGGLAQLAQGKDATAVSQQYQTTFGSDNNIQIAGQALPGLQQLTSEPTPPTLPVSLGVAFAGDDVTLVLHKDTPLPATSELTTLRNPSGKFAQGLGFLSIQIFQGESTNAQENYQLADILLDDENLYTGDDIEVEVKLTAAPDGIVQVQVVHKSDFHREATVTMVDSESMGEPGIIEFRELLERYSQGVIESSHLAALTAVSNWLNITDAERTCIITGERGIGKTTLAALLAQYFRGDRQPPNDLYALAPTSTSAIYFCQPSLPNTLDPRSFALTIASQWASRDSHFAYLQSTIDNHENYELGELVELLLIKPFTEIGELIAPRSIVFLVDDLEAALQHPGEINIVDVILQMHREVYGVRFLLTAQMQPAVRSKLADIEAEIVTLGDRYDNFDIHVGQPLPGPDRRYRVVVSSETGGQLQDSEQTFSPVVELGYERLARILNLVNRPKEAVAIGQQLFDAINRGPNYDMVRHSLETARNRGKDGLRLRLRFDDPTLQAYPWELCHDGRSFIFNNPDQPILLTRTVGTENMHTPSPLPRPVRLLVAIAAPADQAPANIEMQEKVIREATDEVVTSSELDLQIVRHTTLRNLRSAVQSYQPSIVQFVGHSSGEKDGALVLENESGLSNLAPVAEIMQILALAPVQCVILSPIAAGESSVSQFGSQFIPGGGSSQGEPNREPSIAQLPPQFIQQGIPTALAEQVVLPDQPAIEFWHDFYRALLIDRVSFEEAIQNARYHLATTHREPFWSHISLFETSGIPDLTNEPMDQPEETKATLPSVSDQISPFIYGMHDPGKWYELFEENNKTGWVLFHNILNNDLAQTKNEEFLEWANRKFGVMARLVNAPFDVKGSGDGSIPLQEKYLDFSNQCAEFVRNAPDCLIWLIGNEMNMSWHWPNKTSGLFNRRRAVPITPELYAECFNLVYRAIKEVQPNAWVIPSGLNPKKLAGSSSDDTIRWFQQMLSLLENLDGIDIHTYLPGADESDDQNMYAFEPFMEAIPTHLRSLPVFITEATPNAVWPDASDGWMERAYARINAWNQTAGNQKIYNLLPYRWNDTYPDKRDDPWNLAQKQSYLADLAKALQQNYRWDEDATTPPATETQQNGTSDSKFIADITIPDDAKIAPGSQIVKTWSVQNTGQLRWDSKFTLQFIDGEAMTDTLKQPLPATEPGETTEISVTLSTPTKPGTYFCDWRMQDDKGNFFGETLFARIEVPDYRHLYQLIEYLFDLNSLRDLCLDLSVETGIDLQIDYLGGSTIRSKALELQEYARRNQITKELLQAIHRARPRVDLTQFGGPGPELSTSVPAEDQTTADSLPQQDKSDTLIASKSFAALVRLLSRQDVREAVVSFQTDFEAASQSIVQINDYSLLSDLFRELETQHDLISRDQKRLPDDDMAWEDIAIAEPELQARIDDILTLSNGPTFADGNVRWVKQLETVKERLHTAVEGDDLEALDDCVTLLYRVLLRYPSRINAQLVAAASALRLDNLEKAIITISSSLAEADEAIEKIVEEVKGGESALAGLDERFKELVREYNAWQNIDDEVRRVKAAVSQGNLDELEDAWYDLKPMTQEMIEAHSTEEWTINISKVMTNMESALEKQIVSATRRLFMRYHIYVGHRFREVGRELLDLCNELLRVGEQIDLLLRQFNK